MDPRTNPFAPGAGSPPPELAGRASLLDQAEISLHRLKNGLQARSLILLGLRGVGKTVLLNRIQAIAESADYRTASLEAYEGQSLPGLLLPALRRTLYTLHPNPTDETRRALRVLRSFLSSLPQKAKSTLHDLDLELAIDPETGSADSGNLETDLSELLQAVAEAAADASSAIALCVDEIHYLPENDFAALVTALHRVAQRRLPLALVAAGLPQVRSLAGRTRSYADRLFEYADLKPLQPWNAAEALQNPIRPLGAEFSRPALDEIIRSTQGYPYLLQQWAHEAWNTAAGPTIELPDVQRATRLALRRLDATFFRVRFDRLAPREKAYLRALAELGPNPQRSGHIAARLGVKIQSVAPVRDALIRKAMIYSPAYGETAFTTPQFDDFLRRTLPAPSPARAAASA